MKAKIQQMTDNCETCQIHQRQKPRCDPIPESTIADLLPHQQLNMDYGHYNRKNYLIIADRATGYIFAHQTDNLYTKTVTYILEDIINTFGRPDIIRCDNAGSLKKTFQQWAEDEGITINHSSPKNSESNGLAEACVHSFKTLIRKNTTQRTSTPKNGLLPKQHPKF